MLDSFPWEGHVRTLVDVTDDPEIVFPPTRVMEVRAVDDRRGGWIPRPGDIVRGYVDVMTSTNGRGQRSALNVITGSGVPLCRVYVPRIRVENVWRWVDGVATHLIGRVIGRWVASTKWDPFVIPVVDDGCPAALGALADAMDEAGDPRAAEIRELEKWDSAARRGLVERPQIADELCAIFGDPTNAA